MKAMTIEKLVEWAVRDEWPKARAAGGGRPAAPGSGWGAVGSYVQYLAVIDENRFGVVPDAWGEGEPHPDAEVVARALAAIEGAEVGEIDIDWLIVDLVDGPDDPALPLLRRAAREAIDVVTVVDADGARRSRRASDGLVVSAAILGAPGWAAERPRVVPARHANGREVWRRTVRVPIAWTANDEVAAWGTAEMDVVGRARTRSDDAYRVMVLEPSPVSALTARAWHVVWRAAVRALAEEIASGRHGVMSDHEVVDDGASGMPWMVRSAACRVWVGAEATQAADAERSPRRERKKRRRA